MHKPSRTGRREFWRRVLARQAASGLSVLQFCRQEHLPAATAYAWRYRLRQAAGRGRAAALPAVGFAPLRVVPEAAGWLPGGWIEILLPADRRVRLAGRVDKALLADVVAVLTAAGPDGQEG
jgi:hypothetical protein